MIQTIGNVITESDFGAVAALLQYEPRFGLPPHNKWRPELEPSTHLYTQ